MRRSYCSRNREQACLGDEMEVEDAHDSLAVVVVFRRRNLMAVVNCAIAVDVDCVLADLEGVGCTAADCCCRTVDCRRYAERGGAAAVVVGNVVDCSDVAVGVVLYSGSLVGWEERMVVGLNWSKGVVEVDWIACVCLAVKRVFEQPVRQSCLAVNHIWRAFVPYTCSGSACLFAHQ